MDHIEFHREPPSNLTTLVIGFGGWIDAGEAATGTIRHLVRHLSAPRLASIDPEPFFMFTQTRPMSRYNAAGEREIRWPRSEFYTWEPTDEQAANGREGILLFRGMEPNRMWRTYSQLLLDVAVQCGVKRIISLGALLAELPHTRPPRVTGRSTDADWRSLLQDWGIYRRPTYEGPTGIATVLLDAATQRGLPYLAFMAQAPHYLHEGENPAVRQILLKYITPLLDLNLDITELDEAIKTFSAQCDQAMAHDPSTLAHLRQLEQEYDSTTDETSSPIDEEELNSDQLMQELEDFLREERDDNEQS